MAGGVGDDEGVALAGFRVSRVQVGNPAHRPAWQPGHGDVHVLGAGNGQDTDGCGPTGDEEDLSVLRQVGAGLAELGFVVGKRVRA